MKFLGQSLNIFLRVAWSARLFFLLIFFCTNIVLRLGRPKFSNGPFLIESIYFTKTFIRTVTEDAHNYNRLRGRCLKGNAVGPLQMLKAMSRRNLCG